MLRRRAARPHRCVRREQVRPLAAKPQRARDHPQLRLTARADGRRCVLLVETVEQRAAQLVVGLAPVVRVDERFLPELGALVDVGHAGHGELDQLLRQGIRPAVGRDGVDELGERHADRGVVVGAVDHRVHGRLERLVRVDPVGRDCRLAHRLLGVGVHALTLDQADAGEGLPEQVAE